MACSSGKGRPRPLGAAHASPVEALLVSEGFDADVHPNEPMARHTAYRIGGPARFLVNAHSLGALMQLVALCRSEGVPWVVVGRGSNLLVADEGYPGVVITLGRDFRMNAGTREVGIGSRVASVTVLGPDGALTRRLGDEVSWGYRRSSFSPNEAIVECELALEPGDALAIQRTMESALARRKRTQPLGQPSCGSVFRNPEGASVGALVEELGLKGARHGGAQVSEVHGNFIVNAGGAAAADGRARNESVKTRVVVGK